MIVHAIFDIMSDTIDNIDVIDKHNAKMQILKNVFKQFLFAEEQKISDEHLEFIIKISNLI
jgi:hypothetical protein